jgi:hypothetical protein
MSGQCRVGRVDGRRKRGTGQSAGPLGQPHVTEDVQHDDRAGDVEVLGQADGDTDKGTCLFVGQPSLGRDPS